MEGQLIITLKDGFLTVDGPVENALLCYALLEAARDAVHARVLNAQRERESGLVIPRIGTPR